MAKYNLVILDIQKEGVKTHGPTDEDGALKFIMKMCQDQPLVYFEQTPGLYIADLDTGLVRKPTLKLQV